jgi:hypothetical protein
MDLKDYAHQHPVGTETSKCPKCGHGLLFFTDCIGGKSLVLECAKCKSRFYKNCDCELFDLTDEIFAALQKAS